MELHLISVPALERPRAPAGEQNEPGCTPARMDGWDALRVLVGVGRGVMVRTFLRGFFTVGVGVGETAVARAAAGVRVGVAVAEGVGVGVTGSGSALAVVAAEQPAVKASATAAAMSRERIIVPFGECSDGWRPTR